MRQQIIGDRIKHIRNIRGGNFEEFAFLKILYTTGRHPKLKKADNIGFRIVRNKK